MTGVVLDGIEKVFGSTTVLRQVDLKIESGELFFILGPSGCGKSTLLRLIAGLQQPTRGRILFNDRDVTQLDTQKRNAVMCFQSYALWPHLTVRQNVRFGLEVRGEGKAQQEERVREVLELVQMAALAGRKPNELSGGQQQRVALARALAVQPACLLLDEPLSNLDAKLRQEMRSEIRRICKQSEVTTIYVTHDQKEALAAADRIAVMKEGQVAQVGTPAGLYDRPGSSFVAEFLGPTNLLRGTVTGREGAQVRVRTGAGEITAAEGNGAAEGAEVILSVRPQRLRIDGGGGNRLSGRVVESTFLGESSECVVAVGEEKLRVNCAEPMAAGAQVVLGCAAADVCVLMT